MKNKNSWFSYTDAHYIRITTSYTISAKETLSCIIYSLLVHLEWIQCLKWCLTSSNKLGAGGSFLLCYPVQGHCREIPLWNEWKENSKCCQVLLNFYYWIFSHLIKYAWLKSDPSRQNSKIGFAHFISVALDSPLTKFSSQTVFSLWGYFRRRFKIDVWRKT